MPDLKTLLSTDTGTVVQFIKYAICGGIASVTHIVVFHLLGWRLIPCLQPRDPFVKYLHLQVEELDLKRRVRNSMIANTSSFMLSNFVAYLLNALFVFKAGGKSWYVEIGLFYAVSGISLLIGTGLMGWLIRRFGLLTTYAFGANVVSAVLINFVARKYLIFGG